MSHGSADLHADGMEWTENFDRSEETAKYKMFGI